MECRAFDCQPERSQTFHMPDLFLIFSLFTTKGQHFEALCTPSDTASTCQCHRLAWGVGLWDFIDSQVIACTGDLAWKAQVNIYTTMIIRLKRKDPEPLLLLQSENGNISTLVDKMTSDLCLHLLSLMACSSWSWNLEMTACQSDTLSGMPSEVRTHTQKDGVCVKTQVKAIHYSVYKQVNLVLCN